MCRKANFDFLKSVDLCLFDPQIFTWQQSRPFGVALLIAGVDEGGPVLYVISYFVTYAFLVTTLIHQAHTFGSMPKLSAQDQRELRHHCRRSTIR